MSTCKQCPIMHRMEVIEAGRYRNIGDNHIVIGKKRRARAVHETGKRKSLARMGFRIKNGRKVTELFPREKRITVNDANAMQSVDREIEDEQSSWAGHSTAMSGASRTQSFQCASPSTIENSSQLVQHAKRKADNEKLKGNVERRNTP